MPEAKLRTRPRGHRGHAVARRVQRRLPRRGLPQPLSHPRSARPSPWRLALVTILQFLQHQSDRQAADAVRARIDWKYALGLELTDPGFHFGILTEFRARLVAGQAEYPVLDKMLVRFKARGLVKARDKQRTDSTYVLAAVHDLSLLDDDAAHLITHVKTCPSMRPDMTSTAEIHERLAAKGLLPAEHFVDSGYVDAALLAASQRDHSVSLEGPVFSGVYQC